MRLCGHRSGETESSAVTGRGQSRFKDTQPGQRQDHASPEEGLGDGASAPPENTRENSTSRKPTRWKTPEGLESPLSPSAPRGDTESGREELGGTRGATGHVWKTHRGRQPGRAFCSRGAGQAARGFGGSPGWGVPVGAHPRGSVPPPGQCHGLSAFQHDAQHPVGTAEHLET